MNLKDRGPDGLLVLPHVRVQNANAISSSLTHGFPSMTAFLGFMWALGRKLAQADIPLKLEKIGVICHWHQEQTQEGYVRTFRLTRNPVDKDGSTAAIVEEGRIHLDLTLVFQLGVIEQEGETHPLFHSDGALRQKIAWDIRNLVEAMRIAGGSVLPPKPGPGIRVTPSLIGWPDQEAERQALFRRLRRQWLPGFALVGRDDLLQRRLEQLRLQDPEATVLDAWLDLSRFNYRSGRDEKDRVIWTHDRPEGSGWIVPIPVGYAALSDLYAGGQVANARDQTTPFRFVEGVYSIGQWIGPHRLQRVQDLLWWGEAHDDGLYRCCNGYEPLLEDGDAEYPFYPPMSAETL
ncbi:type I-F CRISPR-associated protein Csy2 [Castellaniella sp.]|uniref:type I-F CRISPR-associated protein Csy2 n=1 Tax=Castellaniella sp. TaxID=1955812 RepID=UPI002AFF47DD|nr:type I-F CRISPR-associated protein Csy2 [Castellaniella sp.]